MGFSANDGGAILQYVTRAVTGVVLTTETKWDAKEGKNVQKETAIKDPVIVFFPNGTSQVMPMTRADALGFLNEPEILNLQAVDDASSVAGKFKFAIHEGKRREYWHQMERQVISYCRARGGDPLPRSAQFEESSIFFSDMKEAV